MIWVSVALAQEPMVFAPTPSDIEVEGEILKGILVDEGTFTELGRLRIEVKQLKLDSSSDAEFQEKQRLIYEEALSSVVIESKGGLENMRKYYDAELELRIGESKRTWWERNDGTLMFAGGFITATILGLSSVYAYGEIVQVQVLNQ